MNLPKYLNIACGSSYVRDANWENIDYSSRDQFVRAQDILGGLQTSRFDYEVVYCSHFLEHVPVELVPEFLKKCRKLTRGDGVLRLVVPDAEMLLREYITHCDAASTEKADYAFVLFLDQCVRRKPGGRLAEYDRRISSGEVSQLRAYSEFLIGRENAESPLTSAGSSTPSGLISKIAARPGRVLEKLERLYIRAVCSLLPRAFREQNVALIGVGERHLWMYDFKSLAALLRAAGYTQVAKVAFNTTSCPDQFFSPLDEVDGAPRKGFHQLFVEARP